MKGKLILTGFLLLSVALTGCNGVGSNNPEKTVMKMYEAAVNNDQETMDSLLVHYDDYDGDEIDFMEELADQVYELGGIDNIETVQLKAKDMQKEVREGLNETFDSNWNFIFIKLDDDYIYSWVVQKLDGKFHVVDGEDFNTNEIFLMVDGVNVDEEKAKAEEKKNAELEKRSEEEIALAEEEAQKLVGTWKGEAIAPQQAFELSNIVLGETEVRDGSSEEEKEVVTPFTATAKLYKDPSTVRYSGWHPVTVEITLKGEHLVGFDSEWYREYAGINFEIQDYTNHSQYEFTIEGIRVGAVSLGLKDDDVYDDLFLNGELQGYIVGLPNQNGSVTWTLEKE